MTHKRKPPERGNSGGGNSAASTATKSVAQVGSTASPLEWALRYAAEGLYVLPLEPGGKDPLGRLVPAGVNDATDDADTIRRWWTAEPAAGIGLAVPDDWTVIDVDTRNGGSVDALPEIPPDTLVARTGGGGYHIVLDNPEGLRFPGKLAKDPEIGAQLVGVDILGRGKYICAEPTIHPSGGSYRWENWGTEPGALPAWLLARAKVSCTAPAPDAPEDRDLTATETADLDRLVGILAPHATFGQRHNLAGAIGGLLRRRLLPRSAVEYVVGQLPSDDPNARVRDAHRAYDSDNPPGWAQLVGYVGDDDAGAIDAMRLGPLGALERAAERIRDPTARQGLFARLRAAVAAQPASADPFALLGRLQDFSAPDEPLPYLCEGLRLAASTGKISLIAGAAGGGKGPIADHLAVCFALGLDAFRDKRFKCEQSNTLLLDTEGARLTMRRLRRIARDLDRDPAELDGKLFVLDASGADILNDAYAAALKSVIGARGIGVVVLDAYTSAMLGVGVEANQPEYAALAKMLGGLGVLVLAVAHGNKAAAQRGGRPELHDVAYTQALGSLAQTAIVVHYPTSDKNLVEVSCARAPETEFPTFRVRWTDTRGTYSDPGSGLRCTVEAAPVTDDTATAEGDRLAQAIVDYLRRVMGPVSKRSFREGAQGFGSGAKIDAMVESLLRDGVVEQEPTYGRRGTVTGHRYRLAVFDPTNAEARLRRGVK